MELYSVMACNYNDDSYEGEAYLHDDYYDSYDDNDRDDISDDGSLFEENRDTFGGSTASYARPPVQWRQVRIGTAVIEVCSDGRVKKLDDEFRLGFPIATEGIQLPGTPFRTYTVEIEQHTFKTYYVHDLVYQAFYGQPEQGYEVRHMPSYTERPRKVYSNRLGILTTFPINVSKLQLGVSLRM